MAATPGTSVTRTDTFGRSPTIRASRWRPTAASSFLTSDDLEDRLDVVFERVDGVGHEHGRGVRLIPQLRPFDVGPPEVPVTHLFGASLIKAGTVQACV